jgi:hypothetical protein
MLAVALEGWRSRSLREVHGALITPTVQDAHAAVARVVANAASLDGLSILTHGSAVLLGIGFSTRSQYMCIYVCMYIYIYIYI